MRSRLAIVAVLAVVALVGRGIGDTAELLPVGKAAPEIARGEWINSPPLTLEQLRGRVVLVEFWTYG